MKKYLKLYVVIYAYAAPLIFILALGINRRNEVTLPMGILFLGGVLISLLVALSLSVYKKTWGNGVFNVIVGYLIMFPIPFIMRRMFEDYLFRRPFAIYLLGLIYALAYSLVVLYASLKNKKNQNKLNELIQEQSNTKSVE